MKLLCCCLCIASSFCTIRTTFDADKTKSSISQQWANFVARQAPIQEKLSTRNKLRDDPEQQSEHEHACYQDVMTQLQAMRQEIATKPSKKRLEELELACHILALHLNANEDNESHETVEHIDIVLELAARIKLLQDPFWLMIVKNTAERKKNFPNPSFSSDDLEKDLSMQDSRKDTLIKLLLKQCEERESLPSACSTEAFEELSRTLAGYKKSPEEIASIITHLEPSATIRTKDAKKAIALFNGAAVSEITGNSKFLPLKTRADYLNLEKTYTIAALLYIQSHDHGHPYALIEAEKLMSGDIIHAIVEWKQRNGIVDPLSEYNEIWREIYKRKYNYASEGAASSSS